MEPLAAVFADLLHRLATRCTLPLVFGHVQQHLFTREVFGSLLQPWPLRRREVISSSGGGEVGEICSVSLPKGSRP